MREARTLAATQGITSKSYTVHSTIDVPLQRSVEESLQEGLSRYERESRRVHFQGPETNLSAAIARIEAEPKKAEPKPAWRRGWRMPGCRSTTRALGARRRARDAQRESDRQAPRVRLADGRILPLSGDSEAIRRNINLYDAILVRVSEGKGKARADYSVRRCRAPPLCWRTRPGASWQCPEASPIH